MKTQNFERELPSGYKQVKYINAKDKKFGIIFNLIAVAVLAVVMLIAVLPLMSAEVEYEYNSTKSFVAWGVFLLLMVLYIVLHEIVHGIAYKALTGERLTFGISWSCAFCGVPNVYTYRRTALIALVSPLVVFTLIFVPLTVFLFYVDVVYYLFSAVLLGMHLGGCSGDIYCTILFLFKYKDKKTLLRDTGPEQYYYVYDQTND